MKEGRTIGEDAPETEHIRAYSAMVSVSQPNIQQHAYYRVIFSLYGRWVWPSLLGGPDSGAPAGVSHSDASIPSRRLRRLSNLNYLEVVSATIAGLM